MALNGSGNIQSLKVISQRAASGSPTLNFFSKGFATRERKRQRESERERERERESETERERERGKFWGGEVWISLRQVGQLQVLASSNPLPASNLEKKLFDFSISSSTFFPRSSCFYFWQNIPTSSFTVILLSFWQFLFQTNTTLPTRQLRFWQPATWSYRKISAFNSHLAK